MKHFFVKAVIVVLIGLGLYAFYTATYYPPYEEFSPTFVKRSNIEQALEDYTPKTKSDSAIMDRMQELQFIDEVRSNIKESKPNYNWMMGGLISLLTALGIIGKLVIDYLVLRSNLPVAALALTVKENHLEVKNEILSTKQQNEDQHNLLFSSYKIIEDIVVRKSIAEGIVKIGEDHIHSHKHEIPEELKLLIISQYERLIKLSNEVMDEHFTRNALEVAIIKIDELKRATWKQVCESLGNGYLVEYKKIQEIALQGFKDRLSAIVADNEFNSKYDRYRRSAEWFIDDLIRHTILSYKKFSK